MKAAFKRLVSFRTPLLKGLIFGGAWYVLPAWLFIPVAAYLYFIPFFQSSKFISAFVAILAIYAFTPDPAAFALVGGVLFGWLIAIRELLFIDRRSTHEVLILAIAFFLFRIFYHARITVEASSFLVTFLLAGLIAWTAKGFMNGLKDGEQTEEKMPFVAIGIGLIWFLTWQAAIAVSLVPVDFVYQSLLAFLFIVGMLDLVLGYFSGDIAREKIFFTATAVFCGLVLLLTAAPLGL